MGGSGTQGLPGYAILLQVQRSVTSLLQLATQFVVGDETRAIQSKRVDGCVV